MEHFGTCHVFRGSGHELFRDLTGCSPEANFPALLATLQLRTNLLLHIAALAQLGPIKCEERGTHCRDIVKLGIVVLRGSRIRSQKHVFATYCFRDPVAYRYLTTLRVGPVVVLSAMGDTWNRCNWVSGFL